MATNYCRIKAMLRFIIWSILLFAVNFSFAQSYQQAAEAYSHGNWQLAKTILEELLKENPANNDARIKLGFTLMQMDKAEKAERFFLQALTSSANDADIYFGLALANRKLGNFADAYNYINKALELSDRDSFRQLLSTLPPEEKPLSPYKKPASLQMPFIAKDSYLRYADGRKIIVKGVNMGLALPGKFPAEFPIDKSLYAKWFALIGEMNANVIRMYTIVPPVFYEALREYNLAHPEKPLYILHGVWTELPEGHEYSGAFEDGFFAEAKRVIDLLHGNVRIARQPGHAFGSYDADVSPWLLGLIIGREWEPYSVKEYNDNNAGPDYKGKYLYCDACNPMENWLSSFMDKVIAYQVEKYNQQSPIAFTNWPTLDPLFHITESTREEEDKIRLEIGEPVSKRPTLEYNNDENAIDSTKIKASPIFKAGHFASYHAYPYYPDFMNLDSDYQKHPVSAYQAYLEDLRKYHGEQAVIISEFGVPSSRGRAHINPDAYHHGGHSELAQAKIDVELFNQIVGAGLGGGVIFAWLDEWFKRNWIYMDIEIPQLRLPFWHSVMNAEENYGIMRAAAAGPRLRTFNADSTLATVIAKTGAAQLSALADAEYLHIFFEGRDSQKLELYIDSHPAGGDEFRVVLNKESGQIHINQGYQFFKALDIGKPWELLRFDEGAYPATDAWQPWITEPNRRRFSRDKTIFARKTDNPGLLVAGKEIGNYYNARLDYYYEDGKLHLRLPWTLLGIGDPSQKYVFDGHEDDLVKQIYDIGLRLVIDSVSLSARFTWNNWEQPEYRLELKPLYYKLKEAWAK